VIILKDHTLHDADHFRALEDVLWLARQQAMREKPGVVRLGHLRNIRMIAIRLEKATDADRAAAAIEEVLR